MKRHLYLLLPIFLLSFTSTSAQINEEKVGAWYMYFWNTQLKESNFGLQGDVQYRNWNLGGDLQLLILRGGLNYSIPDTNLKLSAAYGHFTFGAFGESDTTVNENRTQEDILFSHQLVQRLFFQHRLRFEQRWIEEQDFRTRYRYNLALKIPLNQPNLQKNSFYLVFSNEIFFNGEKDTGISSVDAFDRNWLFGGLGYTILDNLKIQMGYMQESTNSVNKGQLELSLHHSF
ncbi:DUF2490 domain-containing protein [Zunongwangia sp. F363]|uniref:DUF2490 domain-containing protein n=1 Tax=Autumnicola tepida TaxID=3075595 RepID=A0ABU3C7C1_9FLAO|nr:DUF2490 domain-containing protein [Zunongwangia sp. F363]MDT0641965.1 DUF2490 domain-containing protein [Zunongwangia sp. F363]